MRRSILTAAILLASSATFGTPVRGPLEFKFDEKALIAKALHVLGSMKDFKPEDYDLQTPRLASIVGKGCDGEPAKWMLVVFPGKKEGNASAACSTDKKGELICSYGMSISTADESLAALVGEYRDLRKGDSCEP